MYICSSCGKTCYSDKILPNRLCEGCYNYFRKGGTISPLPPHGTIAHDHRGYVICHICGRAYVRLGSHVKESHGMSISEYKEKFGLCENSRTTEYSYSQTMSDYAIQNGMDKQLAEVGRDTKIRKGERDKRLGKKIRLQESLDKKKKTELEKAIYETGGRD